MEKTKKETLSAAAWEEYVKGFIQEAKNKLINAGFKTLGNKSDKLPNVRTSPESLTLATADVENYDQDSNEAGGSNMPNIIIIVEDDDSNNSCVVTALIAGIAALAVMIAFVVGMIMSKGEEAEDSYNTTAEETSGTEVANESAVESGKNVNDEHGPLLGATAEETTIQ